MINIWDSTEKKPVMNSPARRRMIEKWMRSMPSLRRASVKVVIKDARRLMRRSKPSVKPAG